MCSLNVCVSSSLQHVSTASEGWPLAGCVGHSSPVSCAECGHMVGGVQGDGDNPTCCGKFTLLSYNTIWQ